MKHARLGWLLAGSVLAAACTVAPAPVPLAGDAAGTAELVGRWEGEYVSPATDRSGSILFELAAVGDTARGDVLMIPAGRSQGLQPSQEDPGAARWEQTRSEVLNIAFVRIEGGQVSGRLSPYRDPDCGCTLRTTFVGTVDGDVITGTFRSEHLGHGRVDEGRWEVRRKLKPQ